MPAWLAPVIGGALGLLGDKQKDVTSTSKAEIPPWLLPLMQQSAGTASGSLTGLQDTIGGILNSMPASAGDLTAESVQGILDYVGGNDQDRNLALKKLRGIAGGENGRALAGQYNSFAGDYSGGVTAPQPVNQNVTQTLQSLMQGNFIGSEGFQANVDASIRQALPYLNSTYAKQGGIGATKGGLANIGIQQAASDAFARLYGDERNRQLGAAGTQVQAEAAQAQAAALQNQASAAHARNRIAEKQLAGGLLQAERGNQINALGSLSGQGILDSELLQNASNIPVNAQTTLFNTATNALPANLIGQSNTTPSFSNPLMGAAGGAIAGAGVADAFGWGGGGNGLLSSFGPQSAESYARTFF